MGLGSGLRHGDRGVEDGVALSAFGGALRHEPPHDIRRQPGVELGRTTVRLANVEEPFGHELSQPAQPCARAAYSVKASAKQGSSLNTSFCLFSRCGRSCAGYRSRVSLQFRKHRATKKLGQRGRVWAIYRRRAGRLGEKSILHYIEHRRSSHFALGGA